MITQPKQNASPTLVPVKSCTGAFNFMSKSKWILFPKRSPEREVVYGTTSHSVTSLRYCPRPGARSLKKPPSFSMPVERVGNSTNKTKLGRRLTLRSPPNREGSSGELLSTSTQQYFRKQHAYGLARTYIRASACFRFPEPLSSASHVGTDSL